jgi:uncharacterized membrane protein
VIPGAGELSRPPGIEWAGLEQEVDMDIGNPRSTAKIMGHPVHPMLVPFPIGFFVGALLSDLVFWQTRDGFWASASVYLLGTALFFAALAATAGFADFFGDKRVRSLGAARRHMVGNLSAVLISVLNFLMRLGDSEGAAFPFGLLLSAVVALILVYTGWQGGELVYRHRVGIPDETARSDSASH